MVNQQKFLLIICIIALCILPISTSASLPMVGSPLKAPVSSGPYQDELFLETVNSTMYSLSNQTVPQGALLLDVKSVQRKISTMSLSPDLYPVASDVNAFLYYTGKAGSEYGDALSITTSLSSPVSQDNTEFDEATRYYEAATEVWERIKEMYPDVTLYTLSPPY
jgi:hypothetical protein